MSPATTDQWTMNWLYYNGRFGEPYRTTAIPWGVGPINTVGKACITKDKTPGADDIVIRDTSNGDIINAHDGRVSAVIHQFDRCADWFKDYMSGRKSLYAK